MLSIATKQLHMSNSNAFSIDSNSTAAFVVGSRDEDFCNNSPKCCGIGYRANETKSSDLLLAFFLSSANPFDEHGTIFPRIYVCFVQLSMLSKSCDSVVPPSVKPKRSKYGPSTIALYFYSTTYVLSKICFVLI